MSTAYYQQQWEDSIADLLGCVQEENLPLEENRNDKGITYKRTDYEWFQYYAGLYLRYLEVYRKLEGSYDQMVHPQKRILMREMLENVIVRMCETKQLFIRYSTHTNAIQSDYINIDEVLAEMKLTPRALKVPIPKHYREGKGERDQVLKEIVNNLNIPEEVEVSQEVTLETNFDSLVRIIQKIERGRQGIVRGIEVNKLRNKAMKERGPELSNEEHDRALIIQKHWRAFVERMKLAKMREQELKFLGIHKEPIDQSLLEQAEQQRNRLKLVQSQREQGFESERANVKASIVRTEEKVMKTRMQDERRKWINKFLEIHEFTNLPNNLEDFYKMKENREEPAQAKKEQAKSTKKNEVDKFIDEHICIGPTEAVTNLQKTIESYSQTWASRACSETDESYFDFDLAKQDIRPEVQQQLQRAVDALINLELDCMRVKYGIKKKKEKKKKPKKKKVVKIKIPQGLGKKNPKDILEELFDDNIAKLLSAAKMDHFVGDHNCLAHTLEKTSESFVDPSMSQVRNLVAEYVGIPLGSQNAKQKLEKWNWFLFYGAAGTGKTLLTRALQTQTSAIVFDISPQNIRQKFTDKSQLSKLIWSVMICAKQYQPSIVLIEDFETILRAGGKSKKKSDAQASFGPKMKKLVSDMKKNKLWGKDDRIAVIAHSSRPYDGSMKQLKKVFDKKIYFPYPNYPTRKLMLQNFIQQKIQRPLPSFQYNTLAHSTEGFTAGSYIESLNKILTPARIARMKDEPLKAHQFVIPLSNTVCVFADEYEKLKKFTDEVTGLKERRESKNGKMEEVKKDAKKDTKKK